MAGDMRSYIRQLEPGKAFFIRERIDDGPWEISWVIKETAAVLKSLGKPKIEFRAALLWIRGVGLIPVLVRVGDRIYETWVNAHADPEILPTLAGQGRVVVHFYAGKEDVPRRSIEIDNGLGGFAAEALAAIGQRPPWSMFAFTLVKEHAYAVYPESVDLWEALCLGGG